jgi:hypothetical protein
VQVGSCFVWVWNLVSHGEGRTYSRLRVSESRVLKRRYGK